MQHRSVKGSFVIMLSLFNAPFFRDWVLPSGNLREFAFWGKKRADACIFTKCPENLSDALKTKYANEFSKDKPSYFSTFEYDSWRLLSQKPSMEPLEHVILVTGIAYPQPLIDHLKRNYSLEIMNFSDHHDFKAGDVAAIHRKFINFDARKSAIICTEKDAVKLELFKEVSENKETPWYCIPIRVQVDKNEQLINQIHQYVKSYSRSSELHTK
jgi:tetraacyldisaccharide 4'-kinase